MTKKKKKKSLSFKSYMGILLFIVSLVLWGLIGFMGVLPLEYLIILGILILIIDFIIILMLKSKGKIKSSLGVVASALLMIIMVIGINYELGTLEFFNQFGSNHYKTEEYNIVVLKDSKYNEIADLENKTIGYLDSDNLEEVWSNIKIEYKTKEYLDVDTMIDELKSKIVDAIILESARMDILEEENPEVWASLRIIDTIKVKVKIEEDLAEVDVTKESFNIYISGIDTYGDITKTSRSDVNMVLSVNPKTKKIVITNIPRDYYVKLNSKGEYDKLTHAGIYGVMESVNTVEDLLDININYYVKVNFTTVEDVVDALGGITVNSNYEFTSQDGYHYNKGINELDGKRALSFARERKSFAGGDRTRGENQQIVLKAMIDKAMSAQILSKYNELLKSLNGEFATNLSDEDITSFIKMQIKDMAKWEIKTVNLDGTDSYQYVYSYKKNKLYVMLPDEESIQEAQATINSIM